MPIQLPLLLPYAGCWECLDPLVPNHRIWLKTNPTKYRHFCWALALLAQGGV